MVFFILDDEGNQMVKGAGMKLNHYKREKIKRRNSSKIENYIR